MMVEIQTVSGNIFRGILISDTGSGIKINRDGYSDILFIPNMRIENVHYFN